MRMTAHMVRAGVLVLALGSAVAAQTSRAQQPGATVIVSGCVQQPHSGGSLGGTPLGTTATPNTADDRANSPLPDPGFVLSGARLVGQGDAASPTGTAGATGSSRDSNESSREPLLTYALVGNEDDLARHLGHTVEVRGVVAPPVEPQRPTSSPEPVRNTNTGADPVGKAFQTGVRQLRIVTMKMVGSSCEQPR